ncbi:hypothetical protein BZG36_01189 [Bifiguratus adelaidae]|uniref:Chitin synthase 4-like domain-containing protein n=1 Tax=Bifiguratus adelaidae TaxID=1938954 RepID=A0A261Y5T9_9FUNG|nr:hypothetical protein BZG36_01189 [Bifiguratus adelaidae]
MVSGTYSRHSSRQSDGTVHSWRSERTRKSHRPYKRSEGSASTASKQLASEDDMQWGSYRRHLRGSKQSNGWSLGTLPVHEDERGIGYKQCWRGFVMAVTRRFPSFCLKTLGLHDVRSQQAWREKMALIAIILLLSTIVGFFTFGPQPVICPAPTYASKQNMSLMATWSSMGNPLYSPFNASGMDASLLFQKVNEQCLDIITPKPGMNVNQNGNRLPTYFPCALYDPIQGIPPALHDYFNYTGCHLSDKAREAYYGMKWNGVKDKDSHLVRGLQIFYTWADLANTTNLVVFNGDVLNIALLRVLPLDLLQVPSGGLIEKLLAFNSSEFYAGTDITHMAFSSRSSNTSMLKEAQCLTDIIKVGVIDTNTIGCITADIVLYLCLIIILGMIVIKFACAVIFGWFLSWQLGNFRNEDRSYKELMRRAGEIENWTSEINRPASAIRPGLRERKSILPQTSRFTTPDWGSPQFGVSRGRQSQLSSPSNIMSSLFLSPTMTYNMDGHDYGRGNLLDLHGISTRSSYTSLSGSHRAAETTCPFLNRHRCRF